MVKTLEKPMRRLVILTNGKKDGYYGVGLATFANRNGDVYFYPQWAHNVVMCIPANYVKVIEQENVREYVE